VKRNERQKLGGNSRRGRRNESAEKGLETIKVKYHQRKNAKNPDRTRKLHVSKAHHVV
jgi:hypothetical protein